jgi:hypothetical protein
LPAFNVDAKVCFDTENVNRGRKEGQANFKMSTEAGVALLTGHGYIGASSVLMLEDTILFSSMNTVSPYIGFCHDVCGWFTIDASVAYHSYTNLNLYSFSTDIGDPSDPEDDSTIGNAAASHGTEFSIGLIGEMLFSPKLYLSYDIDRQEFNAILSASYVYDLGAVGIDHFALKGGLSVGYDSASRPFGIKGYFADGGPGNLYDESKGYVYYGVAADLVYKYNEQATFHIGVRFSGNTASENDWQNALCQFDSNSKNLLWFASAVEFSF